MTARTATSTIDLEDEVVPETIPMSYDEYLAWYDKEAGRRGEWVDGKVIVFMPATFRHESLVGFLTTLLRLIVSRRRLGVVVGSSYEVRTRDGAAREPDLMVVLNDHMGRVTDRRLEGPPDLVIEVISRDSVTRDRRVKFAEYEAAGIREYWLFDPRDGRQSVEAFSLGSNGRYEPIGPQEDGTLRSHVVPGFWFDPDWLTASEEPDVSDLAMRMAGITGDMPATIDRAPTP